MMTEITLYPDLLITDDAKSEKAKRIMEKAEAACLISRSVKTEIKLEPKVSIGSLS
jgi:organic hydroperoxide reductase OsmC/OhrA